MAIVLLPDRLHAIWELPRSAFRCAARTLRDLRAKGAPDEHTRYPQN
jgi:hypothetical protein